VYPERKPESEEKRLHGNSLLVLRRETRITSRMSPNRPHMGVSEEREKSWATPTTTEMGVLQPKASKGEEKRFMGQKTRHKQHSYVKGEDFCGWPTKKMHKPQKKGKHIH